ncbi:hypothetical protein QZH56_20440 [Streptomyces olivoreticuli]|nr:hypothetical protein [Streptomyces olivoreticuli]WKK21235.1 hypothetical protein QZH56_20440 [Streptomyces olivoreticuli]
MTTGPADGPTPEDLRTAVTRANTLDEAHAAVAEISPAPPRRSEER